jgi:ketosteroid isomerase-like protein
MSLGNAEIVQRFLDGALQTPDAVWDIFDDEVCWNVGALSIPDGPTFHGPDGVRRFFRSWIGPFQEWGYDVEEFIDGGDVVVVRIHQWGRGKGSGVDVDGRFWQLWLMHNGKAVRVTHYAKRAEALEAAGLREQDPQKLPR